MSVLTIWLVYSSWGEDYLDEVSELLYYNST